MLSHVFNQTEVVTKKEMTVEKTSIKLKKIEKEYEKLRPKCFQTSKNYHGKNFGHIILTQIPINSIKRHKMINWNSTSLIQFDGFHRLLSLYFPKKIKFNYIDCFLASVDENLAK